MEIKTLVLWMTMPIVVSAQVNLSGVWLWSRPASDPNPNRPSQMWKKIEQQGDHITVRTQAVNKTGIEAQVFVFVAGTRGDANHRRMPYLDCCVI